MTREEAIDIVKCLAWHDLRPSEEDIEQAIEALSEPTKTGTDEMWQEFESQLLSLGLFFITLPKAATNA